MSNELPAEPKPKHPIAQKGYDLLVRFWMWYARKIIGIPFIIEYTPPPGDKLRAITYSWSLEYAQKLKNNWDISVRYADLEAGLKKANDTITSLLEGSTPGVPRNERRAMAREMRKARAKAAKK